MGNALPSEELVLADDEVVPDLLEPLFWLEEFPLDWLGAFGGGALLPEFVLPCWQTAVTVQTANKPTMIAPDKQ